LQVDAHVSKAIFKQAIQGSLWNKTRVLVLSSNYHFLPHADHIIVMDHGAIVGQGTFNELLDRFPRYLCPEDQPQQEPGASKPPGHAMARRRSSVGSLDEIGLGDEEAAEVAEAEAQAQARQEEGQLIGKEERDVGSVSATVWVEYFSGAAQSRMGGALLAIGTLLLFVIGQALRVGVDYVLAQWSEDAELWSPAERAAKHTTYTGVYWALGLLTIVVMLGRTLLVVHVAIKSCSTLHSRLLAGVLRAPVNKYFDVTPVGRILNRFSKDLDAVDQPLPETLMQVHMHILIICSDIC
jgi:ABC-type multidrug transport system fused ATPase/permease subunit